MTGARVLRPGTVFAFDGDRCTIVEIVDGAVLVRAQGGRVRRLRLVDVLQPSAAGGRARFGSSEGESAEPAPTMAAVRWAEASEAARAQAHDRADHVREVLTGFRSGSVVVPRPGEPRPAFVSSVSMAARVRAKAAELGCGQRTVVRWVAAYRQGGEVGLLDGRSERPSDGLGRVDARWVAAARAVLAEQVAEAKVSKQIVLARIEARLEAEHGPGVVRVPSRSAGYVALAELDRGRGTFTGPTKAKRSIANRPDAPFGRLRATRPGEYVLLDTTPVNVFAVAPVTGQWVRAELTVAVDLFSRCVLGLRMTPVSTKSIDVSGVLLEVLHPFERPPEWSEAARWPYHGVPETVLVDPARSEVARFTRAGMLPETLVTDHGKPFLSEHVLAACAGLGISVQPARVYQPTDKAPVERFFRSLDALLQELPGYKGADVASRGADPEADAVYTVPQLEQIVREWVATVYHVRPHAGLVEPGLPGVALTPAERWEQGIAIAGRLRVPAGRDVLFGLLPVVRRIMHHYGVEVHGLRYSGPIVAKYCNRSRAAGQERRWPFHVHPDDLTRIWFRDPEDGQWHELRWEHQPAVQTPFSVDALEYAKHLVLRRGGTVPVQQVLSELLTRWGAARSLTPSERRMSARQAAALSEPERAEAAAWSLQSVQQLFTADVDLSAELSGVALNEEEPDPSDADGGDDDAFDADVFEPMELM